MKTAAGLDPRRELQREADCEVVRLAAEGHNDAWDELLDRFGRLVLAVARGSGVTPNDAADVAQATWLQLVEHIDRIRQPERIAGWLVTTAKREAWRVEISSRRQVLCATLPEVGDVGTAEDEIGERLDRDRTKNALEKAMGRLPSSHRHLLTLLVSDAEMSYAEVAERTGTAIGSIGPTRQRCLAKLRNAPELAAAG